MNEEPGPATPAPESSAASAALESDGDESTKAEFTTKGEAREHRLAVWVAIVGGIVGIPVAVATLYFLIVPPNPGCSGTRSGTLGKPTVDRGVTYRDFLRITARPAGGADEATLNRIGSVIDVPFEAAGYRGKALPLRWTTLTAGGAPLAEPDLNDQLALEVVPEDCSDRGRRKLWAPRPRQTGRYLLEVTLLDEDGELLDSRRTGAFAVPHR